MPRKTVSERFWEKVDRRGPDDCWEWTAATVGKGYGQFWDGTRTVLAHRWVYEDAREPIPAGYVIDHLCRTHNCVNPAHLEVVTSQINTMRGVGPSAQASRRTHCRHGHELTPENVYIHEGARRCKTCHAEGVQRYRKRKGLDPSGRPIKK